MNSKRRLIVGSIAALGTIYWFPYEMIYDGETGAVEYVPLA